MTARAARFPLMDSLRAIAALSIVAYHVAPLAGALRNELTTAVAAQLSTGVALFFLISGFLLYRPFVVEHAEGEELPYLRAYAWRRFLRIVPAYWVALTVTGLWFAPEVFDRPLLFYDFAQVYSPGAVFDGIAVAWTLCIEVTFYAFLPLWALAVRSLARALRGSVYRVEALAVCALFVFGVAWRTAGLTLDSEVMRTSLNTLPAYLAWFAVGMGLAIASAWLAATDAKPAFVRFVERAPGVCWSIALAALAANAWIWGRRYFGGEESDFARLGVHLTEALCALGMILPAVFDGGGGRVRALLAWPVLLWLGMVSYGIYLWQGVGLHAVDDLGLIDGDALHPSLWWIPAGFAACIAAGAFSWYAVERWALSLRGLVPARKADVAAGTEAAARVAP